MPGLIRFLAIAALVAALVFNFFLCFVNTKLMGITDGYVILSEMTIVGTAFVVALTRRAPIYLLLGAFISYMLFIFALRGGELNLKSVRDILIPIAFYFAGMRLRDPKLGDSLVLVSGSSWLPPGCLNISLSTPTCPTSISSATTSPEAP